MATACKNVSSILIHKREDINDLNSHRPISLLSVIYKFFTEVITNEISATLDSYQPREQSGFLNEYSTTDHIHVTDKVVKKSAA